MAVRLEPLDLTVGDGAIRQPNRSEAFELPPVASAERTVQPIEDSDAVADRDRFDCSNLADQLKLGVHLCRYKLTLCRPTHLPLAARLVPCARARS